MRLLIMFLCTLINTNLSKNTLLISYYNRTNIISRISLTLLTQHYSNFVFLCLQIPFKDLDDCSLFS